MPSLQRESPRRLPSQQDDRCFACRARCKRSSPGPPGRARNSSRRHSPFGKSATRPIRRSTSVSKSLSVNRRLLTRRIRSVDMIQRVFTTGVYGKTEDQFFGELVGSRAQTFCDIRMRRGVRGSQYAFVNSTYLQRALGERGIAYRHFPELAPSKAIRDAQRAIDAQQGVAKRTRQELGEDFKRRYMGEILEAFDSQLFGRSFNSTTSQIVLFCVERTPEACHRSLVADRLHKDLGIPVEHL